MNQQYLHDRLMEIAAATAGAKAIPAPGYWVGDKAETQQVYDNIKAGRIHWREANRTAKTGLEYLQNDDLEMAEEFLRIARSFLTDAMKAQMSRANFEDLASPAQKRGRHRTTSERNQELYAIVISFEASGLSYKNARSAALKQAKQDKPDLYEAFKDLGDAAIRKAFGPLRKEMS